MVEKKAEKRSPGLIVLSIKQENGRYVPELCGINSSEQPVYSAHGRYCIDMVNGVHLTRITYRGETYSDNVIEICNPGHKEIDIVTTMGPQTIAPFPDYYDINFKEDKYGIEWIKLDQNIRVDFDAEITIRHLAVSFNKVNSRCDLRIFNNERDHKYNEPIIEARLSYVPIELGKKMIASEEKYQERMRNFFNKKGWGRLM